MAKYTIELRHVAEGHNLFPFYYPFYDEKQRPKFEDRFLKHFYFREIGTDTIDKFLFFLEEKMNTVFPYYNELFRTAQMEYSVLDNYNITEKTTMKRENEGHARGESYAVGQTMDEQFTLTQGGTKTENVRKGESNSEHSETVDADTTNKKTTKEDETAKQTDVKKFLDTPQGAVDLENNKYVTTLNHDVADRENHRNATVDDIGTSDTKTDGTSKTTNDETVNDKTDSESMGAFSGTQKSTNDGTTKMHSKGEVMETVEFTRKGNIGIDTDADMIQKHIKLQQILKKIELMFFDECEDLFMCVY